MDSLSPVEISKNQKLIDVEKHLYEALAGTLDNDCKKIIITHIEEALKLIAEFFEESPKNSSINTV